MEMPIDENSPTTMFTVNLQSATHSTTDVDSELPINSDQFNNTIPATSNAESEKDYDIIMESEQPELTRNVDSNKDSTLGRYDSDLLDVEPPYPHPRPITQCTEPEMQHCTPTKNTLSNVLGVVVPSSLKKSLFWPVIEDKKKNKKKKEKLPSAITSKAWKVYHEKKEVERRRLQDEKENRAKVRAEKSFKRKKNLGRK
ncbi:unnamed protein product [Parnassius apollo]|uniref:(apollo) hypothetical protein n=1 Tax=Parnassius apollo TaxID=110799 RepID=A0A8S3W2R2_PARAO|nr:unnamed protein product [Parnassius apollo]